VSAQDQRKSGIQVRVCQVEEVRLGLRRRTVGPQSRNHESFWVTSITSTSSGSCLRALSTCTMTTEDYESVSVAPSLTILAQGHWKVGTLWWQPTTARC